MIVFKCPDTGSKMTEGKKAEECLNFPRSNSFLEVLLISANRFVSNVMILLYPDIAVWTFT